MTGDSQQLPWGYKLTFSVYFQSATLELDNAMTSRISLAVADAVKDHIPGLPFVGASIETIHATPKHQEGS